MSTLFAGGSAAILPAPDICPLPCCLHFVPDYCHAALAGLQREVPPEQIRFFSGQREGGRRWVQPKEVNPKEASTHQMTISKSKAEPGGQRPQSPLSSVRWNAGSSSSGALLADHLSEELRIAREEATDLIDFGSIQIDGRQERNPSRKLSGSEEIAVNWPWHGTRRHYEIDPQRIVYQDSAILAYDKEPGIPSQQTPSDGYNNLFAALYRYMKKVGGRDPYVALHHRLDQDTSGIMIFALDRSANRRLGSAFEHHQAVKDYLAWVSGIPRLDEWMSREDIGRKAGHYCVCPRGQGKPAETAFKVLHRCPEEDRSLLLARPETGRTHQIRLHLAAAHHTILGDRIYGGRSAARLFLHALRLTVPHPITGSELIITAPVPLDWPEPHGVVLSS